MREKVIWYEKKIESGRWKKGGREEGGREGGGREERKEEAREGQLVSR